MIDVGVPLNVNAMNIQFGYGSQIDRIEFNKLKTNSYAKIYFHISNKINAFKQFCL